MTERPPTLTPVAGGFLVRMRCGTTARERVVIASKGHAPRDHEQALTRYWRLRKMVDALVKAKRGPEAVALIRDAASVKTDRGFSGFERAALDLAATPIDARPTGGVTYREVARMWLSGELATKFQGEVREKTARTVEQQWQMYNKRILEARTEKGPLGDRLVATITLDDLDLVKQSLPKMSGGRRKHYCMLIAKPMRLAEYPLRLVDKSPVPLNFVPAKGKVRAFTYLYPDEEALTMGCTRVDLSERVALGFAARNGMRISEAVGLTLADLDLRRGNLSLDMNKTRVPRSWKLDDDCIRALRIWLAIAPPADPTAPIFGHIGLGHAAARYRNYLRWSGITRRELFAKTTERRPMRVHDLRASFVTLALAVGRGAPTTELWIRDRTGHTTPAQMEQYRRWSRLALDNDQGWFAPLDQAIPELAERTQGGKLLLAEALEVGHEVGHDTESSINSAVRSNTRGSSARLTVHSHAADSRGFCPDDDMGAHGGPPDSRGVGQALRALEGLSHTDLQRVASRCRTLLGRSKR